MITCVLTPNMARHYGINTSEPNVRIVSECCGDGYFDLPLALAPAPGGEPIRLVGLGSITAWKNWHLIIEALAKLPGVLQRRFEFHHWGPVQDDGPSREYDQRMRHLLRDSRLACRCEFHGLSLGVPEVLRTAHWFVLPSTNEPCSVALIEALATGLPALVSASGGNVDVVQDGRTGLLFTPDDAGSLAGRLSRIALGEVQLAAPAEIRESVRARSATAVAAQYLDVYRRIQRCPRPY
jgi:glycosyltransferase involved in cell wall biosynthesis